MQAHAEGKPALPVQIANAARGAIMAVDLAEAGLPGPQASIEGPFGYLNLFETAHDLSPLNDPAPGFLISEVSWKPFPTGRAAHGGIVALQTVIATHGLRADAVAEVVYRAPPLIYRLVGRRPTAEMTQPGRGFAWPGWRRWCCRGGR